MLTVYAGATFKLAGSLQKDGKAGDFTGSEFAASLFDAAGTARIASLDVQWLDQTQGVLVLTVKSTEGWRPQKARIDCRLTFPSGDVVLGPPIYLRIAQSPLS